MRHSTTLFLALISASVILVVTQTGCSAPAEAPTSYERFQSPDNRFSIEYPADWDADGGGKRGILWIKFTRGAAKCTINTNLVDSAMGDIMQAGGGGTQRVGEVSDEMQPEARLHEFLGEKFEKENSGYEELVTETVKTRFGRMRRSEFRLPGAMTNTRGYRATMTQRGDPLEFVFTCPETDWQVLGPVYERMLNSMGPYGMTAK